MSIEIVIGAIAALLAGGVWGFKVGKRQEAERWAGTAWLKEQTIEHEGRTYRVTAERRE